MALTQIQPNLIDSANSYSVSNLAVSGNVTVSGNIIGNLSGNQPNITGLGSLSSLTVTGTSTLQLASDIINIIAGATGVVVHDVSLGGVFYHTTPAANFTANFTNVPVTNNRATMATVLVSQGATAYLPTAVQIEGSAQTIKWIYNVVPTGNANKLDVVSFSLLRTSNSWQVLGSLGTYG